MGRSCLLEPQMLKHLKIQVFNNASHQQMLQMSISMFPKSKNQQTFHCEPLISHFQGQQSSINVTAAMRIFNYQGLLDCTLTSFMSAQINLCIYLAIMKKLDLKFSLFFRRFEDNFMTNIPKISSSLALYEM